MAGRLWHDGATGAVERRPEAFFGGFDFEEVVQSEAKLLELGRREPGSGSPGCGDRACAGDSAR